MPRKLYRSQKFIALLLVAILLLVLVGCEELNEEIPSAVLENEVKEAEVERQQNEQLEIKVAPQPSQGEQTEPEKQAENMTVTLKYFVAGREHLVEREIPRTEAVARTVVEEMYRFDLYGVTHQILPPGTRLLDANIIDKIIYLDFSREFRDNHWGGLEAEVNTIYSIVHTLTQFPAIEQVQFLIEGRQIKTIATGAIDLREPVRPLKGSTDDIYESLGAKINTPAQEVFTWEQIVKEEAVFGLPLGKPDDLAWGDLNGDGNPELATINGKHLIVWEEEEQQQGYTTVWETWLAGSGYLTLGDTTGDGQAEIIAYTDSHIYVFAYGEEGYYALGWQGISGRISNIIISDTTGDGRSEIILLYGSGNPFGDDYQAVIEIWQYNGSSYTLAFRSTGLPFRRLQAADIMSNGRNEIIAFAREGLTVFTWNGKAYVEVYKNPIIGGSYSDMVAGDLTGNGHMEIVLGDGMGQGIYIYTWEDGRLQKIWQMDNLVGDVLAGPFMARDLDHDGREELLLPTQADGSYVILDWDGSGFVRYLTEESGARERVIDILPAEEPRVLYTRQQLASNPEYQLYLGRWQQRQLQEEEGVEDAQS
ncbi:MAG: GerMN domain-containing protein [bacterium]|jgi:germination protein M